MSKILNESNSQHDMKYYISVNIVSNMSKILNESNSQLAERDFWQIMYCFQYVKDTK